MALGWYYTCAVQLGATIQCRGNNSYGELGNGTTNDSLAPVIVSNLSNVTSITAGYRHTCALLSSGSVRCWGQNSYGELGDGTTSDSSML
jgi:alpha-tubulin suppressor-like RCC1 family protein